MVRFIHQVILHRSTLLYFDISLFCLSLLMTVMFINCLLELASAAAASASTGIISEVLDFFLH